MTAGPRRPSGDRPPRPRRLRRPGRPRTPPRPARPRAAAPAAPGLSLRPGSEEPAVPGRHPASSPPPPPPHRAARTDASPAPGRSGGTPTAAGHGPYGKEYAMIQQIVHETSDTVDATAPAGLTQALAVAKDLHGPARRSSDAVAFPELMGLRIPAGRPHRYKVPLRRLTAMAA
ncbi:hypothetical protein GCM10009564_47630 [Streptomyces thermogriseus]|uniref:Uncharacterized protein n=1 Tax=Streptomyces thermogriseus TaxID=75292 RepID=A0ABN1T4X1_9ACTN